MIEITNLCYPNDKHYDYEIQSSQLCLVLDVIVFPNMKQNLWVKTIDTDGVLQMRYINPKSFNILIRYNAHT